MVYLHENMKEVEIKYDFSLALPQAQPADPDDPDEEVVVVAWATESDQIFQSIYYYFYYYTEKNQVKTSKKIKFLCERINLFQIIISLFFDNYIVFTVIFVIKRNLRNLNRDFWQ